MALAPLMYEVYCIHELVFKTLVICYIYNYIYRGLYIQLYRNIKGIPRIPKNVTRVLNVWMLQLCV